MTPERSCWRAWATRPEQQNEPWRELLVEHGLRVAEAPLLAIEPVSESQAVQAIRNLILDIDQFDKIIFVSQNAVETAFNWLNDYWPQLPTGIDWFAVGKKTADKASEHGITVTAADRSMTSDELLAMPAMQQVWGQKILICRGVGGLPRLGEVLRQRGAMVRFCELYERCLPLAAPNDVQAALQDVTEQDLVPLFSGETLQNLVTVLEKLKLEQRSLRLIVPGRRVAELAHAAGFSRVLTAPNASEAAMLQTLLEYVDAAVPADGQS